MAYTVLYVSHAPEAVYQIIRAALPTDFRLVTLQSDDPEERLVKIRAVDFAIGVTTPITADMLTEAKRLKLIQHQGVGYDSTDVETAQRLGIPIGLTPEGTSIGVAEHVILLILAVYKQLVVAHQRLVEGEWLQFALRPNSFEMYGKTLGLIGLGRIGREVAKRAQAFGTRILFFDKYLEGGTGLEQTLPVEQTSLDDLLQQADILSIHVPLTRETRGMVDLAMFQAMKPSSIFINTSRGKLVKESDLYHALTTGLIAGAGLDVFEREPVDGDNPLLHLENVVLTPHISAGTRDALATKMRAVFANMLRVTRGETPINLVAS